jgi:hypothetical protein
MVGGVSLPVLRPFFGKGFRGNQMKEMEFITSHELQFVNRKFVLSSLTPQQVAWLKECCRVIKTQFTHVEQCIVYAYSSTVYTYINAFRSGKPDEAASSLMFTSSESAYMWFAVDHIMRTEKRPEAWFKSDGIPSDIKRAWQQYNKRHDTDHALQEAVVGLQEAVRKHKSSLRMSRVRPYALRLAISSEPSVMFFYQAVEVGCGLFGAQLSVAAKKFLKGRTFASYIDAIPYVTAEGWHGVLDSFTRQLDELFGRMPSSPCGLTLYRGTKWKRLRNHRGYCSTSLDRETAEYFADEKGTLHKLRVSEGQQHVLPLMSVSRIPGECEVLLHPDCRFNS